MQHFLEELDPFPGLSDTDISNYLYNEGLRIEPRDCKQPPKFPRKWPELSLKSPGIKAKRQSHNNTSTISRSNHWPGSLSSSTTGELSPTCSVSSSMSHITHLGHSQHSQQDFSVFANVHIHNSSSASSSQMSSSFNQSNVDVSSIAGSTMTLQHHHTHQQQPPPELPMRSNSIMSMTMTNSSGDRGAILSPRAMNLKNSPVISPKVGNASTPGYHHQHHMSADMIDFQAFYGASREFGMTSSPQKTSSGYTMDDHQQPPLVLRSPPHKVSSAASVAGGDGAGGGGAVPSPGLPMSFDFAPPISPHVNVPPKAFLAHSGRYMPDTHVHHLQMAPPPPPLPPRVRRRDSSTSAAAAQHRQAPDAPQLPPRDISPPPLPPRTQSGGYGVTVGEGEGMEVQLRATDQLKLPNTSTIMLRRNSAAAQAAQQQQQGATGNNTNGQGLTSSQSSYQLGQQEGGIGVQQTMSSTRIR